MTYQISKELALVGIGQSTVVGIGGDPVVGSSFIDVLGRLDADPDTDLVVMVGEIGGAEEEKAADFIAERLVDGTAQALEARGVLVGTNPSEVAEIAKEARGSRLR